MSDRRLAAFLVMMVLAGCSQVPDREGAAGGALTPEVAAEGKPSPGGILPTAPPPILYPSRDASATYPVIRTWAEVVSFEPYPYKVPLPALEQTPVDGVYGKLEPGEPQWWRCARCPDFRNSGGNWRLMLSKGTMRLYYEVTGFSTVATYSVRGDRLELQNDPHCPYEVGEFEWSLQEGVLVLREVSDSCAIGLRAANLVHLPWISCQPPNTEAAITDHWIRPPGCG